MSKIASASEELLREFVTFPFRGFKWSWMDVNSDHGAMRLIMYQNPFPTVGDTNIRVFSYHPADHDTYTYHTFRIINEFSKVEALDGVDILTAMVYLHEWCDKLGIHNAHT